MKLFKSDLHLHIGFMLILLSGLAFIAGSAFGDLSSDPFSMTFFINYFLALLYFVLVWRVHGKKFFRLFGHETLSSHALLLVLFNISAYSLNKTIPIFHESTSWLVAFLVTENVIIVVISLTKNLPKWTKLGFTFLLGIAILFNLYQLLMVTPTIPIGLMASFFLGISLLILVPFFYLYGIIALLRSFIWSRSYTISLISGISFALTISIIHTTQWIRIDKMIDESSLKLDKPFAKNQLPDWIILAQKIDKYPLFESYLKTGLIYQEFNNYSGGFFNLGINGFIENQLHDPLISIATIFSNKSTLDDKTKIQILNYLYDARHESGDRFWSGKNLSSSRIVTNVELFPQHRLSFTEMIITIENNRQVSRSRWGNMQEAFYTFQLPEGGVVTSLSLWIAGQEEKAVLTSKKKAKKAYSTIVGREMRDPSVVYWMEGNQVRVRVFPCAPEENRKFKIGITAPLSFEDHHLHYSSITFKGPKSNQAKAAINLVTNGAKISTASINQSSKINFQNQSKLMEWTGAYQPTWSINIEPLPLSTGVFSFQNEGFTVSENAMEKIRFSPQNICLDINSSWTESEIKSIHKLVHGFNCYILRGRIDSIDPSKISDLQPRQFPNFTLFPFHDLKRMSNTLIITKGGVLTPNLSDLDGSRFKDRLFSYFRNNAEKNYVIDLADEPSSYMRSLNELQVIDYHYSTVDLLAQYLKSDKFPTSITEAEVINIPSAGISIAETNKISNLDAPDHLMRLFYYQKALKSIGRKYFEDDENAMIEDSIVDLAEKANIVTPLSSLIVLETQKDYDRFGIKQNKNSLGNASINNSGAVPEPHEWALIISGIFLLAYVYFKHNKKKALQCQ